MIDDKKIVSEVCRWIEKAVIGLELCPFAKSVYQKGQINFVVSESGQLEDIMLELHKQILRLRQEPEIDTTLLIFARQLQDFAEFNAMLDQVDALLNAYEWVGEFQIASFHPHYQFADTQSSDRENWSNRSPYPILHILREASVARAISHYPEVEKIPEKNIQTLRRLDDTCFKAIFYVDE